MLCEEVDVLTSGDKIKPPYFAYQDLFPIDQKIISNDETAVDHEEHQATDLCDEAYGASTRSCKCSRACTLHWTKSVAVYLLFMGLGLSSCVLGPTLVPLEHLLYTDTHNLSFVFTGIGLGYIAGGWICGVTLNRSSPELQFGVAGLIEGLTTALAPNTGHLVGFMVLMGLQAVAMGFIDTGANVYAMTLWEGHRGQDPFLQGMHGIWCVGSTIGPLILHPFLQEHVYQANSTLMDIHNLKMIAKENTTGFYQDRKKVEMVRFGYVTIAGLAALTGLIFLFIYITDTCTSEGNFECLRKKPGIEKKKKKSEMTEQRRFRLCLLAILFVFFFLYYTIESTTGNFLSTYAVKHLGWDVQKASVLTSVLWGALGVGRVAGALISAILSPTQMLLININLTVISFFILLFSPYTSLLLWLGSALAGYGMSSTFATGILWTSRHIAITSSAYAVFITGSSLASIIMSTVMGHLFQSFSPMCLVYVNLAVSGLLLMIFALLYFYTRSHKASLAFQKAVGRIEMETLKTSFKE